MRALALAALLLAAAPLSALVQPRRINFQGKLIDASTQGPKAGPVDLILSLYDVPSGGSPIYTETQTNVAVTNGVFSVQIGTNTALPRDLFLGASVYLGVTVSGDPGGEMAPRRQLVMSPYAFSANQLSDASDVRLIAGSSYSTFTSAGNFLFPAGVEASSASFDNSFTASTATLLGGAFTVGGSTFVVGGGSVGVGAASPAQMLDVNGAAQFGATGKSGFDAAGNLALASGSDLNVGGASGFITGQSSFNASAFFGDGSGLTGLGLSTVTIFTANGTWTKSLHNPNYVIIEAIGGGGSGGAVINTRAGAAGGGGGGAYAIRRVAASALGATETVTVSTGAAAAAAGNNPGQWSGDTSFGTWVVADGGGGGSGGGAGGAIATAAGGPGGTTASSVGDVVIAGGAGKPGYTLATTSNALGGSGGRPARGGGGGLGPTNAAGAAGGSYGGGGSGAATTNNTSRAGGAGAPGLVLVWEFK